MSPGRQEAAGDAKEITPDIRNRLETGFRILEVIRKRRILTNSPGLGWAIEQSIIGRELEELEREWKANPAPGVRTPARRNPRV
jgi:hypothetical protein